MSRKIVKLALVFCAETGPDPGTRHDEESLRLHIAEAAYLRAASRGFEPGHALDDWLEAEAEILALSTNTSY